MLPIMSSKFEILISNPIKLRLETVVVWIFHVHLYLIVNIKYTKITLLAIALIFPEEP